MRLPLIALLVAAASAASCQRVGGPDVQLQRMMEQPRYQAYGASAFFADGMAMQAPPAGTIAREDVFGDFAPPPADSATLALGRDRYAVACAACHGAGGFAGGVVATNLGALPGLVLQSPSVRALSAVQLFARIGVPGDVRHARAAALSPSERWAVALYTRALVTAGAGTDAAREDSLAAAARVRTAAEMAAQLRRMNGAAP